MGTIDDTIKAYWEVNATYNFIKAAIDEWYGKTNPTEIFSDWAYHETILPIPLDISDWHHVLNNNMSSILPKLRPTHPMYTKLRENLIKLHQWESLLGEKLKRKKRS